MEKFKVKVTNKSEVLEIEKILSTIGMFSSDYSGFSYPKYIANNIDGEFSDYTMLDSGIDNFKLITIQELREMVNPMKEYLEKQADGSYELVMRGIVGKDDDIEVPDGGNVAYKDHDSGAIYFTSMEMGYRDVDVLWQRHTQPEELPFVDSLNDQYTEIEQVRQAIKVESGSDSDHSLDAMSYGYMGISEDTSHVRKQTIEATLAERQAQYGCFEDVARTTGKIMEALSEVRVNGLNDLPYPHRMALYMIASKMARLVNGDFNSIDEWHDISGYATLVERLIDG